MPYLEELAQKRSIVAQNKAAQLEREEIAKAVVKSVTDKGIKVIAEIGNAHLTSEQTKAVRELRTTIEKLSQQKPAETTDNTETNELLKGVISAIEAIQAPQIDTPAPQVTVNEREIDFTPLQDTIKEYFTPPPVPDEKIDLNCYRAQDIKEDGDIQYVGFVNPDGHWYIIENKIRENQLRYVFGDKGYAKAFTRAGSYTYKLLNEAINEVRS